MLESHPGLHGRYVVQITETYRCEPPVLDLPAIFPFEVVERRGHNLFLRPHVARADRERVFSKRLLLKDGTHFSRKERRLAGEDLPKVLEERRSPEHDYHRDAIRL